MPVPEAVDPIDPSVGPDPLPESARRAADWIGAERLLCSWRTPHGFLVLTNLRCIGFWRQVELFGSPRWHSGPNFFFYNLAPPRVVLGRFVELDEEAGEVRASARFAVRDPELVRGTISASIPSGRREWLERRRISQAENARLRTPPAPPVVVREIVREVIRVPCRYCGRLMDDAALRCPNCGAPHLA